MQENPSPNPTPTRVGVEAHNAAHVWDGLWSKAETRDWRGDALAPVYRRIAELIPREASVVDIGGGVGMLASILGDEARCKVTVWEHNSAAIELCQSRGIVAQYVDLETNIPSVKGDVSFVSTEVLEHLSDATLENVMRLAKSTGKPCFFSVPNDRLGPDEEPQHARKWTALGFLNFLRRFWPDARVEVLGHPARLNPKHFPSDRGQPSFLLGVVGIPKGVKLSACFPARDEAEDIERCLASLRGVADEIVIGIDPRTKDATREIAEKYAEIIFDLTELQGPPGDEVPAGGFHFAHARNQCMDRCTMPWIFMTEAHEPIVDGHDVLLHLDHIEEYVQVGHVVRQGGRAPYREQWLFPWLCRNRKDIRYTRSTHNTLDYGDHPHVTLPQIKTLHERVHARTEARHKQRKVQNRLKLMEDWRTTGNNFSLSYLGSEWREFDGEKAIKYMREYLNVGKFGVLRYHTRLMLAKELTQLNRIDEAREALHAATADDWSRIEHFIFLGDLAFEEEQYEQALVYYTYASTRRGNPPLTTWWIDTAMYTWIPAQRLAQTFAALGRLEDSLRWGMLVLEDFEAFGDDAPEEMITEAKNNIKILEDAINGKA